jgi:RNA polymerase sigma-70 factor (ECF subfamily)
MQTFEFPRRPDRSGGDHAADVLELFHEHGAAIYRFCRVTVGRAGDAEDVVQETFLKLLQHLHGGGDRTNLRAWLFTVAANGCRDRIRWRIRLVPWQADLDTRTVEAVEDAGRVRQAREALRRLPPRDRLLLSLRAEGLSYREIAAATRIREASIGRLLARAVDRWKRQLESRVHS